MRPLDCPACENRIRPADVNVRRDIAYCGGCGHVFTLSEHVEPSDERVARYGPPFAHALQRRPRGIRYDEDGEKVTVAACVGTDYFLLMFAFIWAGFISVMTTVVIIEWHQVDDPLLTILALSPFNLVSLGLIGWSAFRLFGQHRIEISRERASVFSGVFGIGRHQTFDPTSVKAIECLGEHDKDKDSRPLVSIVCEDDEICFGHGLPRRRAQSLALLLRITLHGESTEASTEPRAADAGAANRAPNVQAAGVVFREHSDGFELTARVRNYVIGGGVMLFAVVFWTILLTQAPPMFGSQGNTLTPIVLVVSVPFLIGGVLMVILALFHIFGVYRIHVDGDRGELFVGIFGIGRRQRFDPASVSGVRVLEKVRRSSDGVHRYNLVAIDRTTVPLTFGARLSHKQRKAIVQHLRRKLLPCTYTDQGDA